MIRSLLSLAFGACIAAPLATILATQPLPRVAFPLESAVYTAVEDGKVSDAVRRAHVSSVVELNTVTVVGRVGSKQPKPKQPKSAQVCVLRPLEQGGSPSAPFVLVCG